MHLPQLLEQFEPETDPVRRHMRLMLAMAWSTLPSGNVHELVEWVIHLAGPVRHPDRRMVEEIALEMLFARGPEVTA